MKNVVIAGSGFAGVSAALALHENLKQKDEISITIVDRKPYHTIHGFLYEVATSPEELTDLSQLKQSVTIPLTEIFSGTKIKHILGTIVRVDQKKQEVQLDHGVLPYDYLVLALGSSPNFYGIPGAEQFSVPLKTVRDALAIRNRLQFTIEAHRLDPIKQGIRITIAGGGFAGVEMAAELSGLLNFLAWKNNYPRGKLEIMVVEGANQLMPGLGQRLAVDVNDRLRSLGVQIRLDSMVTNVTEHFLEFDNGERLEYDVLVWAAGVQANQVKFSIPVNFERGNRLATNQRFQLADYENIFTIGDECCYLDSDKQPLPGTAQQAIDHGKYVGQTIARLLSNLTPEKYQPKRFGYLLPLGGKWAILTTPHFYIKGFLAYVLRQYGWFRYFREILGLRRALRLSILENRLYVRND